MFWNQLYQTSFQELLILARMYMFGNFWLPLASVLVLNNNHVWSWLSRIVSWRQSTLQRLYLQTWPVSDLGTSICSCVLSDWMLNYSLESTDYETSFRIYGHNRFFSSTHFAEWVRWVAYGTRLISPYFALPWK